MSYYGILHKFVEENIVICKNYNAFYSLIKQAKIKVYERRHLMMSAKKIKKFFKNDIVKAIIIALICSIPTVILFLSDFLQIPKQIEDLNGRMSSVDEKIGTFSSDHSGLEESINGLKTSIDAVNKRCDDLYTLVDITTRLIPSNSTQDVVSTGIALIAEKNDTLSPIYMSKPTWVNSDVIAIDNAGKEFTAHELVNQKLLLPYSSNGQEVYFYGQFNENNQWHGDCVINVYQDNELVIITEATYNNGVIQKYKQVLPIDEGKSWIISDRQNRGNYNSGESWHYVRNKSEMLSKSFNIENVSSMDILTVDNFRKSITSQLEGYYYGNTSDGMYNDNTGTSYLIKYDKFGQVRTLYCGNFKNGQFDDNTVNAWYITRDVETNTDYMYYKGNFKNGKPTNESSSEFKNNLTLEEINLYLEGKVFSVEINWASTDSL